MNVLIFLSLMLLNESGVKDKREEQAGQTTLVFPPYLHSYGIRKATQTKLYMISKLSGFHTKFNDPQGITCVRLLSWEDTSTERDDDELTVYGVNSGNNEIIYNISMYRLARFGSFGSSRNQFSRPLGIAADNKGRVYVCDSGNNRVVKLYNPKQYLKWVKEFGTSLRGKLRSPQQIAITSWGDLYVTDYGNNRIAVFDSAGNYKGSITGDTVFKFYRPTAIALCDRQEEWQYLNRPFRNVKKRESSIYNIWDRLYIVDNNRNRLIFSDFEGNIIKIIDAEKERGYPVDYQYMAIDYYGNVYITEKNKCCIHKYSWDLKFLESFGKCGDGDREFDEPRGIVIYGRFGQVFVAERHGAQYYWIGTDIKNIKLAKIDDTKLSINFFCTEPSYFSAELVKKDSIIAKLVRRSRFLWGENESIINLPVNLNRIDKNNYKLLFIFEPTYSSYTYFWKRYKLSLP